MKACKNTQKKLSNGSGHSTPGAHVGHQSTQLDLVLLFDLLTPHLDHPQLTEREGKIRIPWGGESLSQALGCELVDGVQGADLDEAGSVFCATRSPRGEGFKCSLRWMPVAPTPF